MVNIVSARGPVSASGASGIPGVLVVLACSPPLCPHVEFAVSAVLSTPVSLTWVAQPSRPGQLYAALEWRSSAGTAGRLAGRLRGIGPIAYEVVEGPATGCDSERYSFTPELGLHRASISANGDVTVGESALRALLDRPASQETLAHGLERLLGTAWDDALEPLRRGGHGAPVTWLRRTG